MGVSRDCGEFTVRLTIRGGVHSIGARPVDFDEESKTKVAEAMAELQAKHEEQLLDELCEAIGWDKDKAKAAADVRIAEEQDLLAADATARKEYRARRAKARV